MDRRQLIFSRIAFSKEDLQVDLQNVHILGKHLPITEILRENYSNIEGTWQMDAVNISGIAYPFPPLAGKGEFSFISNTPQIGGAFESKDKQVSADFVLDTINLRVKNIRLPWEGAKISAKNIEYSFITPEPIYVILYVDHLQLGRLLNLITGDKATATGFVAGAVPVVFAPDGGFMPGAAKLISKDTGIITIAPELLAGDNTQMEMARTALSNFHYKNLSLTSQTDKDGKLSITLEIEGNNPNAFDGKSVKLNVNLTGDVLELLEQSLLPSANPTKFLEQK